MKNKHMKTMKTMTYRCATWAATPTLFQLKGKEWRMTPPPPLEREDGKRKSPTTPFNVSIFNIDANSWLGKDINTSK